MKKAIIILALVTLFVLVGASAAFANFGPHGGYAEDTDACAGCHRAHTSFSTLTWTTNANTQSSALLVSAATTMEEFCLACHGDAAPGASTNVEVGIFDAGPSSAAVGAPAGSYAYQTNSTYGAVLNGGAFTNVTSMHDMEAGAATDPMWGDGSSAAAGTGITCTSCHDVHGSSNYRLLKDTVNGHTVGGYTDTGVPRPYVFSSEQGYPISLVGTDSVGGWLKHEPGAAQMATYRPNYTTAEYYFSVGATYTAGEGNRSMSTWCSSCHEAYNETTSAYDYGDYESNGTYSRDTTTGLLSVTGDTAYIGSRTRHRHPVDITPASANTINGFGSDAVTSTLLPLEKSWATYDTPSGTWELTDYMGCLTCHRAHGTSAEMTGWANARLLYSASGATTWSVEPTITADNMEGVNPNFSSSLLRTDNRGVCERCHNK